MSTRKASPALLVAGAAAAAGAVAWFSRKRSSGASGTRPAVRPHPLVDEPSEAERDAAAEREDAAAEREDALFEPESATLPVGHSADPEIDDSLGARYAPAETSGASLLGEAEAVSRPGYLRDASLDEVWDALPGFPEAEQTEGYDAVSPEDLGSVWLERATQTTHEGRPHPSDPNEVPALEDLAVSEASLLGRSSSYDDDDEIIDDDEIADDELDEPFSQR